jgi:hypothetical protein
MIQLTAEARWLCQHRHRTRTTARVRLDAFFNARGVRRQITRRWRMQLALGDDIESFWTELQARRMRCIGCARPQLPF